MRVFDYADHGFLDQFHAERLDRQRALCGRLEDPRTLQVLGEPRVHVLALNLALDAKAEGR